MEKSKQYQLIFWLTNLGLVLVKILFTLRPEIDLFTEEAQYWLWSRNLDWHYYSKPPMIAGLNFISTSIFGSTELAIRLIPMVLGLGTSWVIYWFAHYIYQSHRIALWSSLIFLAMPISFLEFTFHTTDTSMTFFWTLGSYLLYRAVHSSGFKWWIHAGLVTALGLMSKMTMILIFPFLIFYLIYVGELKAKMKFVFAFFIIAAIGFLPVLIWNFQNEFYTFKHLAALGGAGGSAPKSFDAGLVFKRSSEYLGGQLAIVSVFFLPFFYLILKKLKSNLNQVFVFLLLPGALTFLGFLGLSFTTWVEVNWPGFAYSTFSIALAAAVLKAGDSWRIYRKFALSISFLLPVLFISPNFLGWKSSGPIFKIEKSAFKRLLGYDILGKRIDHIQDSLQIERPVVFSDSYHVSSELSFYLNDHPQTFTINMGSRKNQFDLWPSMEQYVGQEKTFVFVSRGQESPIPNVSFEKLIFEEDFPFYYGEDSVGKTKIQVWKNLLEYNPANKGTF